MEGYDNFAVTGRSGHDVVGGMPYIQLVLGYHLRRLEKFPV